MGLFSFLKNAGEKLLHGGQSAPAQAAGAGAAAASTPSKTDAIIDYINRQGLQYENLTVSYDGKETVTVEGVAPDQTMKEKIILCCGNVEGVAKVDDKMTVENPQPESKYHTVASGDTLSKISKTHYGDPGKYPIIFEANKPMLKDPDKIYPGQVLRIPAV